MAGAAVHLERSRTYPVDPEQMFDRLLPLPLEALFARRYLALPAIRGTDQDGVWGTPGQQRTIRLADGGTMRERLVSVERPRRFTYVITDATGPMKPVVARVEGAWAVEPARTGCRVTWTWDVEPAGGPGGMALPVVGRMWNGYADRALATLETLVVG